MCADEQGARRGRGVWGVPSPGETTVKDRKIGEGLLAKMLADLGIDRDDF